MYILVVHLACTCVHTYIPTYLCVSIFYANKIILVNVTITAIIELSSNASTYVHTYVHTTCTYCVSCSCILSVMLLCAACTYCVSCSCILYVMLLCAACTYCVSCFRILSVMLLCAACTYCVSCFRILYAMLLRTYVLCVHRKDLSKCVLTEITLLIEDEELSVKVVAVEALVDIVPHVNKGGPQRFTL